MDLNIEQFSPTRAEIAALVATAKTLDLPDPYDFTRAREVRDARLALRTARTNITKIGKALREDALTFQRKVIEKEKELVALITPEEQRLQELEDAAELAKEREARKAMLPKRRERLAAIGDGIEDTDEALLDMDGTAFEGYLNRRLADKNEADRIALEQERWRVEAEKERMAREQEIREAEERGRIEAAARAEREHIAREQQAARDAELAKEREAKEKSEAEAAKAREEAMLEKDRKYQAFLTKHGYEPGDKFMMQRSGTTLRLYKLVGTLEL